MQSRCFKLFKEATRSSAVSQYQEKEKSSHIAMPPSTSQYFFLLSLNSKSREHWDCRERCRGAWEWGKKGWKSEIPEVRGKFCPFINRLESLWNFIDHKVDSMLCSFYSPARSSCSFFFFFLNKLLMSQHPNNHTPELIFSLKPMPANYTRRAGVIVKLRPPWNK